MVKNLPANAGDVRDAGSVPGWKEPLEEAQPTPALLPGEWTEEPDGLHSIGSQRVGHD